MVPDSLSGSTPMPFRLDSLTYREGAIVDLSDADIIVLVGPNNSGKSRTLQELWMLLSTYGPDVQRVDKLVLEGFAFSRLHDAPQLHEWLSQHRQAFRDNSGTSVIRTISGGDLAAGNVPGFWNADGHLGPLAPHLVRTLWSGERLNYLGSPTRGDSSQRPEHPTQLLVRDAARLGQFSTAFRSAFKSNVIVDAWGHNIRLRVSRDLTQTAFRFVSDTGLPDGSIQARFDALPLMENQSDGVKSFAGILLTLLTMPYPLILLDEPEAFLHPPQARLLGRYLSTLRQGGQMVVATHSLDILLGLLEARPDRVKVVRLRRVDDVTRPLVLDGSQVEQLWRDPLLRFSRSFDGLFHEGVVVGEGDTDSQFYSAIAYDISRRGGANTQVAAAGSEAGAGNESPLLLSENPFDVMFTYSGGKQRMATIARALTGVGVPVRVIADFDVLNDRSTIAALVEALGGELDAETDRLRGLVDAGLRGSTVKLTAEGALAAVTAILSVNPQDEMTSQLTRRVHLATEPSTGWSAAKRAGIAVVPGGQASEAVNELLERLATKGLFVVPSGEVESFVRSASGKGPRWVTEVIERGLIDTATAARDFIARILASFETNQ